MTESIIICLPPAIAGIAFEYLEYIFQRTLSASIEGITGRIVKQEHLLKLNCENDVYDVYVNIDGAHAINETRQYFISFKYLGDEEDHIVLYVSGNNNRVGGAFSDYHKGRALSLLRFLTSRYMAEVYNPEAPIETTCD